jgi:hypothetical protein
MEIGKMVEHVLAHLEMVDALMETKNARQERMDTWTAANLKELREDIKGNQERMKACPENSNAGLKVMDATAVTFKEI